MTKTPTKKVTDTIYDWVSHFDLRPLNKKQRPLSVADDPLYYLRRVEP